MKTSQIPPNVNNPFVDYANRKDKGLLTLTKKDDGLVYIENQYYDLSGDPSNSTEFQVDIADLNRKIAFYTAQKTYFETILSDVNSVLAS